MSTDRRITKNLIETLEDGRKGFASAAQRIAATYRPELSPEMTRLSAQRANFSAELDTMADAYRDDIDESGSVAAAVHRGWMALKDTLSGSDAHGVIDAAVQGEDHALSEYEKALEAEISPNLRSVVERQLAEVRRAHDLVKHWQSAA